MDTLSAEHEHSENRLRQIREYIRHLFQLFLTWFTVFATINYAALGWLAATKTDGTFTVSPFAWPVAAIFIVQNVLGIIVSYMVRDALISLKEKAFALEMKTTIVPIGLYSGAIWLIMLALAITAGVWGIVLKIISVPHTAVFLSYS